MPSTVNRMSKQEENDRSVGKTLRGFCTETTAHGPGRIASASSTGKKIFWSLVLFFNSISLMCHLYALIYDYFQYPTVQTAQWIEETPKFPDITTCNNQPYTREGLLLAHDRIADFLQYRNSWNDHDKNLSSRTEKNLYYVSGISAEVANLGVDAAIKAGQPSEDLFVFCQFVSKRCDVLSEHTQTVQRYFHPNYLNCYTIKGAVLGNYNFEPGVLGGLSLIMHSNGFYASDRELYLKGFTDNQLGLHITLHEQNTVPNVESFGIDIEPGKSTSMAISAQQTVRLPPPFGECSKNIKSSVENFTYTVESCRMDCMQRLVIQNCSCFSAAGLINGNTPRFSGKGFCQKYSKNDSHYMNDVDCERNITTAVRQNPKTYCGLCERRCKSVGYQVTKSQVPWPEPSTIKDFLETFVAPDKAPYGTTYRRSRNSTNDTEIAAWVRRSFYRLNIYFAQFRMFEMREQPKTHWSDLLSSVGGTLGLWIGISVFTITELLDLLCVLSSNMMCRASTVKQVPEKRPP